DLRRVIGEFRDGGGEGKEVLVQVHLSWAPDEREAERIAVDQWGTNIFSSGIMWNLELPTQFEEVRGTTIEQVRSSVIVSSDLAVHLDALAEIAELGVDGMYLHHVGQQQTAFIEAFGENVVPQLARIA
ncbi:MAG: class F420-dependent oxidoreductase, partial [Ilumatobacteraceae bacterium]|nr:class F420-dependent oxidoreductase [Ilumatobacteraceae bacterium]